MKIGIVTQTFYPYPGGVTEHVYCTYRVLTQFGHDVKIITTRFERGVETKEDDVIRIGRSFPVLANGSLCPVAIAPNMDRQLASVFRSERFDVIHIHEPLMPFLCLKALEVADAPVVATFHASNERPLGYRLFHDYLDRRLRRISRRIAVSEAARKTVETYFGGEYTIIPNGVDVERFALAEPFPWAEDGNVNVLFVGRMEPRKGLASLLNAFPSIARQVPEARLIVVGGGRLGWLYRLRRPRGCDARISWEGVVSFDDLPRYYRSADVYCSPATGGESFGIVLLEAMAAGCATVASDILGYRAVIDDGTDGVLVPHDSVDELADAIVRLAKDEGARERLTARARAKVESFSWDKVTRRILEVYESAVGGEAVEEREESDMPSVVGRSGSVRAG